MSEQLKTAGYIQSQMIGLDLSGTHLVLIWSHLSLLSSFLSPVLPARLALVLVEFFSLVVVESVLASEKTQYNPRYLWF